MTEGLADIGERFWDFLRRVLAGRNPERDVPESAALLHDLVDILSSTGVDNARWDLGRRTAMEKSAAGLADSPELWNEALKLATIYFSSDWRPEHPRTNHTMTRNQVGAGRVPTHPVSLDLELPLLDLLLATATEKERLQFLRSVDDWGVLKALEGRLPTLHLTQSEMAALLVRLDSFGKNDGAIDSLLDAVKDWAGATPSAAKVLVEAWLQGQEEVSQVSPSAIEALIEGIVQRADDLTWKDYVLEQLDQRSTEDAWRLAAFVACFAWPEAQRLDVGLRHSALLTRIRRFPALLVPTGLWALNRDTFRHPTETLKTALELVDLLPSSISSEARQNAAVLLAELSRRAVTASSKDGLDVRLYFNVLDRLVDIPAGRSLFSLDALLQDLSEAGPSDVIAFLTRWITRQAHTIIQNRDPLHELFPLLSNKISGEMYQAIARWLIASDPLLRTAALALISRTEDVSYIAAVQDFTEREAIALATVLAAGESIVGSEWVSAVIEIGLMRKDIVDNVARLLSEGAVDQYPALVSRSLERWSQDEPWKSARSEIMKTVAARQAELDLKSAVPELFAFPTLLLWYEWQQRQMNSAYKQANRQSPFLSMITKVPIARGEASTPTGNPDQVVPFATYSSSTELPILELVDPVAAMMKRRLLEDEAGRLVAQLYE